MNKYISYEKLSKKEKKKLNNMARKDWNGMSPVTRCPKNPRAYDRAKEKAKMHNEF